MFIYFVLFIYAVFIALKNSNSDASTISAKPRCVHFQTCCGKTDRALFGFSVTTSGSCYSTNMSAGHFPTCHRGKNKKMAEGDRNNLQHKRNHVAGNLS